MKGEVLEGYRTRNVKRNVGSYVLIERDIDSEDYGEGVLSGQSKYISEKSGIKFDEPKVLYFEKDIQGVVKLDEKVYDAVYYYDVIINFQTARTPIYRKPKCSSVFEGAMEL